MRFSEATRLSYAPGGLVTASPSPAYWNLIGPFGGWIAAILMRAVVEASSATGAPLSASISFAAAIEPRPFEVRTRLVRANRSTAFWQAEIIQDRGSEAISCAQATIVLAERRDTPAFRIASAPEAPPSASVPEWQRNPAAPAFLEYYDIRFVRGGFRESEPPATTLAWVRDREAGAILDFPALIALCDIGLPHIFLHARKLVPVSTIVMNAYFHASAARLAEIEGEYLRFLSHMRVADRGYFDMTSELWSEDGTLLATTEQIVWYKIP